LTSVAGIGIRDFPNKLHRYPYKRFRLSDSSTSLLSDNRICANAGQHSCGNFKMRIIKTEMRIFFVRDFWKFIIFGLNCHSHIDLRYSHFELQITGVYRSCAFQVIPSNTMTANHAIHYDVI